MCGVDTCIKVFIRLFSLVYLSRYTYIFGNQSLLSSVRLSKLT